MDDVAARVFGPIRRYLRTDELIALGIAGNRGTIRNLVRRGELPAPIKLGRLLLFPAQALAARLSAHASDACETPTDQ